MSKPYITALSHSGGLQSQNLLDRILDGEIEKPFNFVVLNANPGMERRQTRELINQDRERCAVAGIDYITAQGPSLYSDIVNSRFDGTTRLDNPPYWTKDAGGEKGQLVQGCTQYYKIAPMRRALRHYLSRKHGISWNTRNLRPGLVEMWIGFSYDEWHRCSDSDVGYIVNRFPFVEMKVEKAHCAGWYLQRGLPLPVRSVCNGCFANGLAHFKDMYENEPEDWQQAVACDNALETWKGRITKEEVFVSSSLIRLRDLPSIDFGLEDEDMSEHHCNSGVCFV
jgi:hypothetical protein